MKSNDNKLLNKNVKPTAMRELVLNALLEQNVAVSLSDLEKKFEKADKVTLYRTLKHSKKTNLFTALTTVQVR